MGNGKGYNGWTNYETWNVALWAGGDEPVYRAVQAGKPYTPDSAAALALDIWPQGTPDMSGPADMIKVDWREIADAWNEE